MPVYEYRCAQCGVFDLTLPMGAAPSRGVCPTCGVDGPRVFTVPMLSRLAPANMRARTMEERSAHEPEVVTSVPARADRRPAPSNPAWSKLPRP